MSNNQPYAGTPASSAQVAALIENLSERDFNWKSLKKLLNHRCTSFALAQILMAIYSCVRNNNTQNHAKKQNKLIRRVLSQEFNRAFAEARKRTLSATANQAEN